MSTLAPATRKFVRDAMIVAVATSSLFFMVNGTFANPADAFASNGVTTQKVEFKYVTVQAGQTLWSLADELAPNSDPRDWIADVVNLNGLSSVDVQPGLRLALPAN